MMQEGLAVTLALLFLEDEAGAVFVW